MIGILAYRPPYGLTSGGLAGRRGFLGWMKVLLVGLTAGGVTSRTEALLWRCLTLNGKHIGENLFLFFLPKFFLRLHSTWNALKRNICIAMI